MTNVRLATWVCFKNRRRMMTLVLVLAAALTTYVTLGAVLRGMSDLSALTRRWEWPWDMVVTGPTAHIIAGKVEHIPGVSSVIKAYVVRGIIQSEVRELLAIADVSQAFSPSYTEGVAPRNAFEIAIPSKMTSEGSIALGRDVSILPLDVLEPVLFRVSGILAGKTGNPSIPVITPEGASRIAHDLSGRSTLLVSLDGKARIGLTESRIRSLASGIAITSYRDQYSTVKKSFDLAGILAGSMRSLILVVSAASVTALSHLWQREQAYQMGIFRAVGNARSSLLTVSGLQAVFVTLIGTVLAYAAANLLRFPLALQASSIRAGFLADALALGLVTILSVCSVSFWLLRKSIHTLLSDPWGRV